MKQLFKNTTQKSVLLGAAVLGLGFASTAEARTTVKVDGSSTVFPITEAVAEEFQNSKRGKVLVTVGISGTGGGFKKFCRGETDIQDASRPIKDKEVAKCKEAGIAYIELPVAYDAITLVVSKDNTWLKDITMAELKKVWEPAAQEKITTWNQVREGWPNKPIRLYGAGADSGTFDYFTEVVNGTSKASRSDYTSSEDDNTLVQGVSQDIYALGYVPFAYYENNTNKLTSVGIKQTAADKAVKPSLANIATGAYSPFARPIFIYVSTNALKKPEVDEFVAFYLKNAPALVKEVQYVPLSTKAYELATAKFTTRTVGAPFANLEDSSLDVEKVLAR